MSQFYPVRHTLTNTTRILSILSVFALVLFFSPIQAQFTIFTEDFEDHGNTANGGAGRYTSASDFFGGSSDYFGRIRSDEDFYLTNATNGNNISVGVAYSGQNGDFFYAGEDLNDTGPLEGTQDGSDTKNIIFTGININGATNMLFRGLFARGENDPCTQSTYDDNDFIEIYYNIDGGGEVLGMCFNPDLECNIPGDISNEPLYHDPNCDGDGGEGTILSNMFQEFTFPIPGSGSLLDLRVSINMDAAGEEVAVDFFRVESDTEVTMPTTCPVVGAVAASPSTICEDETFDLTATGLADMDMATNMDADFGIEFVAFTSTPADPYMGGTSLGTVPFGSLTAGNTVASLVGASLTGNGTFEIYAILSPAPTDGSCRPSSNTTLTINATPVSPTVSNIDVCVGGDTEIIPVTNIGGDIWEEDFETHGNTENGGSGAYTSLNEFWDGTSDYWGRVNGATLEYYLTGSTAGNLISTQAAYDGWNNNFFYAGEDLDDGGSTEGSGLADPVRELSITGIDITGASSMIFRGLLAVGDDDGCNASEFDAGDYIRFYYTIDGGSEQTGICFAGALNCPGGNTTNEPLFDDPDCNGDGIDGSMMFTSSFAEFEFNIPGSGSSLDIRVEVSMNSADEEIAFDYFRVISGPSGPMSFNFYDGDPDMGGSLLAGDVASYDPMTTPGTSPQSVWVTGLENGCESDAVEVVVTVGGGLSIGTGSYGPLCEDDSPVTLTGMPAPGMGETAVWSGTGVTDASNMDATASFDPSGLSGNYTLTYTVTDVNGCSSFGSTSVAVNNVPTVDAGSDFSTCNNTEPSFLVGTPAPGMGETGVWSGMGVTDMDNMDAVAEFNPAGLGGSVIVTYTFTDINGCTGSDTRTVTVNVAPIANAGTYPDVAENAADVLLTGTPAPGPGETATWSGTGVTDASNMDATAMFDPSGLAGMSINLTYSIIDVNGCSDQNSTSINVTATMPVSAGSYAPVCEDAPDVTLTGTPAPGPGESGIWTGTGVTDASNSDATATFDPSGLSGPIMVTYRYVDINGRDVMASTTITVNDLPTVTFTAPADICLNAGVQAGLGGGTPPSGVYTGTGVIDDGNGMTYSFDPAAAGVGTHTLTYTYTDINGCTNSASDDVEVFAVPSVSFTAPVEYCENDGVQMGLGGGTPPGGVYSGTGVTDDGNGMTYTFDPTGLSGPITITYTYTDANGCTESASDFVYIYDAPVVDFTAPADLCIDAGVQAGLGGGTPSGMGGVYTGTGVTDDGNGMTYSFDPAAAGVGVHTITYTYTGGEIGCTESASDDIEVFGLPTVTFSAPADLCKDAGIQSGLGGGLPMGGVYSGPGVTDDGNGTTYTFDPQAAGSGINTITYTYTDANGCTSSASDDVEVFPIPVAPVVSDIFVCQGESTEIIPQSSGNIWIEDFESNGNNINGGDSRYMSPGDFYDGGSDHWGRVEGATEEYYLTDVSSGSTISPTVSYSNWNGNFFYAGEDLDDPDGDGLDFKDIIFENIAISSATGFTFKGLFGTGENDPCGESAYDDPDFIEVYYNIDGAGEVLGMCFNADLNCEGDLFNEPLYHDPNCDGDGGEGTLLTASLSEFSFSIPDGSCVDIRIRVSMDAASEEVALDYLRVEAATVNGSTYNFYDADPAMGGTLLASGVASYDPMTTLSTSPQSIWVTKVDANCESEAVEVVVEVSGTVVDPGEYEAVCENGDVVMLVGMPAPGDNETATWSGMGVTDASITDAEAIFDPAGLDGPIELTYTFVNSDGCVDFATTTIVVNEPPIVQPSSNNTCQGETGFVASNPSMGTPGYTFLWTDLGTGTASGYSLVDPTAQDLMITTNLSTPGTVDLMVVVTDSNGCTGEATFTFEIYPLPVITVSECMCAYDEAIGNYGSQVLLSINNGEAPYTVTTTFGTLTNMVVSDDEEITLFLGQAGGAYTINVTDANGCMSSFSSSCEGCFFDSIDITDPCSCNNDQSYNGSQDGTFGEVVDIIGPPGLSLIVGAGSTGLIDVNVGDPIPEYTPGTYRLRFDHVDLIGYTIFVEGEVRGNTFPILDANGNQLTITNVCQYPVITEPVVDMDAFCNNGEIYLFTGNEVTEINGFSGFVTVDVNGEVISSFDPTLYQNGFYTLRFTFTGDFVNNISVGGVPAFPGCETSTSVQIGVGGGGTLTCNDHVNISVNNDCELDFSWYTLMESDYIPNVFDAEFTDAAGNIIPESDLGLYVGQTVTYSIIDMCNGNSCWGTMAIDDKSIPEVSCDCPVGGETGIGDYSEDCTLTCWELPILKEKYWDRLRDGLVPEMFDDFIDDNVTSTCNDVTEEDISFYDEYIDLGHCEGTLLRRTWMVDYDKGNGVAGQVSCTREYFFKPVGIETLDTARIDPNTGAIVIPEDSLVLPFPVVELTCGADISPAGIAAYFDNPGTEDQDTDDDRLDPQELDIDVVIENNEGIPFAYPHYWVEGRNPSGPHAQPIDTEVCSIIVGYTDQEIEACAPGCDGNRKVLRNWTILDWCTGEFVEYGQIIKSIDQDNPSLVVNDVTASVDPWKCSADVRLPHPEHIYDDCDSDLSYYIGYVEGGLTVTGNAEDGYILHDVPNGETISVEYYTADCCGNRGNAYIDVTVSDLTPPVPVTKQYIVLSLTNIANPVDENQGIAKLYAEDVDNGSYDGCTDVEFAVRRVGEVCPGEDTTWGDFVKFCCEDLDGATAVEIDVHFRVTDEYGNVNYAWATVLLEDKSGTNQTCPPDMVLTCDMDYNDFTMTGLPRLFSACGEIDLDCDPNELIEDTEPRRKGPNDGNFAGTPYDGVEVPAYDPSCGFGAIRRQFRSCSSCTQWFVIEPIDAFDASTISFPDNQVVDCDGFDTGEPDWEPATCNLVGVTVSSDTFRFEDGACYKILNHWSIINWCEYDPTNPSAGGRYDHTQEIKIIDTQDPVLTVADSLCFAVNVDCVSEGVQMSASGNDEGDCGSEWLKWEVIIDLNSDWTNDMYFGTDLPRLVNGVPNPYYIAPTGNDELATITLPDGLSSSKIWHRSVWRLYDGCGNNVSAVRYFQITDKKAPTPYCLNISTAVMSGNGEVELWAIDFNVGSFDNCTDSDNLLFTFTDVAPPARDDSEYDSSSDLEWYNGTFWYYDSETGDYQDQDDYGDEVHRWEPELRSAGKIFTIDDVDASGFAQIPIYVWDECGNTDYCLVNLRIIDNMGVGEGRIAGQIMTESGDEVEGVMTELMSEAPEYPAYNMTNSNGEYAFNSVAHLNDYEITGTKNDDYLNGVSTLDLLLMQRHILGQEQLDSPYKMIAADVNEDKEISALDLIELRKLILGVYSALPNTGSWKVIDASQQLSTINPWIYNEYLRINNLEEDMMHEDFVGVKIGDVNGSVQANTRTVTETSNRGVLTLTYNDATVKTGDLVELSLTTTEAEVYGYQFTMGMSGMELVEVSGEGLSEGNVGVFADRMTISYNSVEAMNTNESVMTVVMRATQDGQLSELVNINSDITKAEAYVGKGLEVVNIDMGQEEVEGVFALYQNQPNPFTESTVIGFDLPESTEVTMSFYDVTGRVLRVIEREGQKGYNEVRVDKEDLGANGMIYYKLETKTHTATQHMMMIE